MPHLLYTAVQPDGSSTRGFVDAASAKDAHDQLEKRGLTNISLHQEVSIAEDAHHLAGLSVAEVNELARFKLLTLQKPGLTTVLQEVARLNWLSSLTGAGLLCWGGWSGSLTMVGAAIVIAGFPFAFAIWRHRHADRYTELIKAHALGQWSRMEELAGQLREVSRDNAAIDFDLDVRLASATARKGEVQKAFDSMAPWRARMEGNLAMFETRMASIHAAAEDRAGFVACMERGYAHSGHDPARALDYALALARFGDLQQAQTVFDTVDTRLLPPHAGGFVFWTRGVIEQRLGHPQALDTLSQALSTFLKLGHQPAVWTALAFCTCDHAVALSMAGNKEKARLELAHVWPVIQAHADQPLLRMLQTNGLTPA